MWEKISNVLLVVLIPYFIYLTVCPSFLGSQIDREYASKIDTDTITQFAESKKTTHDTGDYIIEQDDENRCIEVYFRTHQKYPDSSFLSIRFEVFDENKYSSRVRIRQRWVNAGFLPDDFDTVTLICKNNVRITVSERTDNPRSKNAQLYLEEILSFIEN